MNITGIFKGCKILDLMYHDELKDEKTGAVISWYSVTLRQDKNINKDITCSKDVYEKLSEGKTVDLVFQFSEQNNKGYLKQKCKIIDVVGSTVVSQASKKSD